MLKSMTGYGRCEETVNGRHITAELKSVNHKYFEFSPRVTRGYGFLEDKLKISGHDAPVEGGCFFVASRAECNRVGQGNSLL